MEASLHETDFLGRLSLFRVQAYQPSLVACLSTTHLLKTGHEHHHLPELLHSDKAKGKGSSDGTVSDFDLSVRCTNVGSLFELETEHSLT